MRAIASQLVEHGRVLHSGRAWLGVQLVTVPEGGVLIASARGPAASAGVRAGETIVNVAGHAVRSLDDVAEVLARNKPGSRISLALRGPDGARSVSVTLGELP